MVNNSKLAQAIFFVTVLALSAVALGAFDEVEARHTEAPQVFDPGISVTLMAGTNVIAYRDSSNDAVSDPDSIIPVIDTSNIGNGFGFVRVTISEDDSNLDAGGIDVIFATMTSTTSGLDELEFELNETTEDSAVFTGDVPVSRGNVPGKLRVSSFDQLTVLYEPQHVAVPRMSATLLNAAAEDIQIKDFTIDDPDGFGTRRVQACPYDLVIHPVQIQLPSPFSNPVDEITITLSYGNAELNAPIIGLYDINSDIEMVYRTGTDLGISGWVVVPSASYVIDNGASTFTGTLNKAASNLFTLSGQYALGHNIAACPGGGGGGLVRPGLVVNALAGIGALGLGGGSGSPGPTITLGAVALSDSGSEIISMPQEIRDIALNHDPYTPLEPITDVYEDFDLPLSINGDGFALGGYENTLQTQTIQPGEPTEFVIVYYTNSEIAHISLYFNLGPTRTIAGSDTQVLLYKDKPAEVIDPNGNISSATGSINNEGELKRVATFSITFSESAELSNPDMVIRSWTDNLSSGDTIVYDAIEIAQPEIVQIADEDIPEPEIQTLKSQHVPIWIKNNANWWSLELIEDSDFVAGLEYLIQNEIVIISDSEVTTNEITTQEIPSWIKNTAGWWSEDLITEKEFIDGLQWLITNGIIQVTET